MSRYAQSAAVVPEPCFILGTPMRPFCLGHHLLFKRVALPFCDNPFAPSKEDQFYFGVAICGQSYDETLEQFINGSWPSVFAAWKRQLARRWYRRRIITPASLDASRTLFQAYLQDGYERPPVWRLDTVSGVTLSAPWELFLKNRLILAGYSESEIMNGYLPGRWYDYFSASELEAAKNCADPKKWRKIFFTEEDAKTEAALTKKE